MNEINSDIMEINIFDNKNIDSLCLSGGGTRALLFIGAIKKLIDRNIIRLNNIKKYIGTSAGSMIAFLLTIGYNINEIEDFFISLDFNKLEPEIDCNNMFLRYGLDDGAKLIYILNVLLKEKLNVEKISFKELYEKTNIVLIVTAVSLTENELYYFSHESYPDMDVILSLKCLVLFHFITCL